MQIFLKPNEAQSYFTTSWILSQRHWKRLVELSPLVSLCGKLVIFELWGSSIPAPQQPVSLRNWSVSCLSVFCLFSQGEFCYCTALYFHSIASQYDCWSHPPGENDGWRVAFTRTPTHQPPQTSDGALSSPTILHSIWGETWHVVGRWATLLFIVKMIFL